MLCKEEGCGGVLKHLGVTVERHFKLDGKGDVMGGMHLYGCVKCKRVYYRDSRI